MDCDYAKSDVFQPVLAGKKNRSGAFSFGLPGREIKQKDFISENFKHGCESLRFESIR